MLCSRELPWNRLPMHRRACVFSRLQGGSGSSSSVGLCISQTWPYGAIVGRRLETPPMKSAFLALDERKGIVRYHVLFAIELATLRVNIMGTVPEPEEAGSSRSLGIQQMYSNHCHKERNHQGLGNKLIEPTIAEGNEIVCESRFGGLLNQYRRVA